MKRTKKLKVVMGILFVLSSSKAFSQGYIEGGFIPNRDFLDNEKISLVVLMSGRLQGSTRCHFL